MLSLTSALAVLVSSVKLFAFESCDSIGLLNGKDCLQFKSSKGGRLTTHTHQLAIPLELITSPKLEPITLETSEYDGFLFLNHSHEITLSVNEVSDLRRGDVVSKEVTGMFGGPPHIFNLKLPVELT